MKGRIDSEHTKTKFSTQKRFLFPRQTKGRKYDKKTRGEREDKGEGMTKERDICSRGKKAGLE